MPREGTRENPAHETNALSALQEGTVSRRPGVKATQGERKKERERERDTYIYMYIEIYTLNCKTYTHIYIYIEQV